MIAVQELRIGNWIKSDKTIGYSPAGYIKVGTIGANGINHWQDMGASGGGRFEDLQPIPLTPELLIKAGFEDFYDLGEYYFNNYMYKDGALWFGTSEIEVKHLHQLQNLYFALTGEELKINL